MRPSALLAALPFLPAAAFGQIFTNNNNKNPGDYAPISPAPCPTTPLLRQPPVANQTLNPREAEYIAARERSLPPEWRNWLGDGSAIGYDINTLGGSGAYPRIGIAVSGGGYRASQYGAGTLSAFDARNETSKSMGTGGLLQVSSYLAGLSGGSWMAASLTYQDFPTLHDLVHGTIDRGGNLPGWMLDLDLFIPDGLISHSDLNEKFYGSILWSVDDKAAKGFDTSLTDPWARALSYHFLGETTRKTFYTNESSHGAGILWSDIPNVPSYQNHKMPFPVIVVDSRPPGMEDWHPGTVLPLNATVYEITPYELGSWDPDLSSFVDIKYLGTRIVNGTVNGSCVTNFDQAGFMFGTSSSLFNQIVDAGRTAILGFEFEPARALLDLLRRMLEKFSTRADDVANYPSPFTGINPGVYQDWNTTWLELCDGATNQENIPLGPLFAKARHLDVIVSVDGSGDDAEVWPSFGLSLFATRNRSRLVTADVWQTFPPMPETVHEFREYNLGQRVTFFGCNPQQNPPEWPLLLHFPNQPPLNGDDPVTNSATFKLRYSNLHTTPFLDQAQRAAFSGFTPNSQSPDANFGKCLQCAAIDRARLRTSPVTPRSAFCEQQCFARYCYDPANPPAPGQIVGRTLRHRDPDRFGVKSFWQRNKKVIIGVIVALLVTGALIIGVIFFFVKRRAAAFLNKRKYRQLQSDDDDAAWRTARAGASFEMGQQPYTPGPHTPGSYGHGQDASSSSYGHGQDASSSSYGHAQESSGSYLLSQESSSSNMHGRESSGSFIHVQESSDSHLSGGHTPGSHSSGSHSPGFHTPGSHSPALQTPPVHTPPAHTPPPPST